LPADPFWNGPAAAAEVLRTLRSFNELTFPLGDQSNWDYGHHDGDWPGIIGYLKEKNYDTSRVGANIYDLVADKNVILESKVEDTEECKYFKCCL